MKNPFSKISKSFNSKEEGASSRKMTAFVFVLLAVYIHLRFIDESNAINALIVDSCFISFLLGMVTADQLIKFKNGKKGEEDAE